MSGPGAHLNDEQFAELMLGMDPSPAAAAHLAGCTECRAEMGTFRTAVEDLSAAGLHWSRAHQPAQLMRRTAVDAARHPRYAMAGWALAAAALAGVAVIPAVRHNQPTRGPVASVEAPDAAEDSDAQIAQDNQLLKDVSLAIRSGDASADGEYGLKAANLRRNSADLETSTQ